MMKRNKLIALVDGDILAYRCAAACEVKEYTYVLGSDEQKFRYVKDAKTALGDNYSRYTRSHITTMSPPEHCLHSIRCTLDRIKKETHANKVKVFLGGKDNFRDKIFKEYKAGRSPKPHYLNIARDYLTTFYAAEIIDEQEVDDELAQRQNHSTVICGIDKDLYQVPGAHYNWVTDKWKYISIEEGNEWFWIQMLVGDGVDNIKAIDGIGLITAVTLINMFGGNMWQIRGFIQAVYMEEYSSLHEYYRNIQLLYIRRRRTHDSPYIILNEVVK